ncbi:hypothetical protein DFH28DRAFT_881086, partial [Melampsora americana]
TTNNEEPKPNAQWTTRQSLALIDCLQEQSHLGHRSDNGWKPIAWTAAVERLSLQFPPSYDVAQMKNHYTSITSQFWSVRDLKHASGTGWNEEEQRIVADAAFWTDWHISQKNARQWEKKSFPLYNALDTLIGHNIPSTQQSTSSLTQPTLTQPIVTQHTSNTQTNDSNKRKNPFTSTNHQQTDTREKKFAKPTPEQPTNLTSAIAMMSVNQEKQIEAEQRRAEDKTERSNVQLEAHRQAVEDLATARLTASALNNKRFPYRKPAMDLFNLNKNTHFPNITLRVKAAEILRDEDSASFFINLDEEERWEWLKQKLDVANKSQ